MHECPPFQRQTPAPLPHAPRCRRRGWNPGCRRLSRMPETWARRHSLSYEWIGAALRTIAGVLACPVALGRCAAGSVTTSRVATLPAAARCAHGRPPPGIKHHHPPTCSHTSSMPMRHVPPPPPPPHTHTYTHAGKDSTFTNPLICNNKVASSVRAEVRPRCYQRH